MKKHSASPQTILTHTGRDPFSQHGFVNTPVTRGSTVLFPDLDTLENRTQQYGYGRRGNPSTDAVEAVVTELEGAHGTRLTPSGLAAISTALLSLVRAGDEILVSDSAYEPTRSFCDSVLSRLGVTTRYYDPRIGGGISELLSDKVRLVFVESPGSLTFEVQDLPAISAAAHAVGASVIVDNSWGTPLYYQPLKLGADMVVHAATKMFVGHSDSMSGTVSANEAHWKPLLTTHGAMGTCLAPDEAFLIARGLRTLELRMREHASRSVELAAWLEGFDIVERVLHPALPSHPDHALFKRDFSGAGSTFSMLLKPAARPAIAAMLDGMGLFSMGYSWGGYESLIIPAKPQTTRTAVPYTEAGNLFRLHIGFEGMEDLKADLEAGLQRYSDTVSG